MRSFLIVLVVTICGFGDAFLTISMGNRLEDKFVDGFMDSFSYTYEMMLGNFDTNNFGSVDVYTVWFLFYMFSYLDMIIMLNLLIAIISDSYANVQAN